MFIDAVFLDKHFYTGYIVNRKRLQGLLKITFYSKRYLEFILIRYSFMSVNDT